MPDFILQLREQVGHDLLWLPGVTAVVLRDDAQVLLVKRADNGHWSPVSGIVEPGEHPAVCAPREVFEETNVEAEVEALAAVGVTPPIVYPNGDRAQYLDHTFRCRYVRGDARVADDESTAVGWFPLDALPEMTAELRDRIMTAHHHGGPTRVEPPPASAEETVSAPRVLVLGLDPYRVPGPWDPQPVADGIEVGRRRFLEHGLGAEFCLFGLDGSDDVDAVVTNALAARRWECVVIGGGVRGEPALLEQLVNLVRRHAPDAAIAFNATPADTYDAAARWVDPPG